MASHLARAARRLSPGGIRGLADALADAGPGSAASAARQAATAPSRKPWLLASVRAHTAGGSEDEPAAAAGPSAGPTLGLEENTTAGPSTSSSSSRTAAEAAAAAAVAATAAAPRARPPPGHTDFQQRQLLMLFTCTKCNTRAAKAFSKQSYESGVVIVECPGCHNKHLIADHLGWFGQKGTVEEFAAERGSMVVRKMADGTVELTPEDLLGASLAAEAEAAQTAAAAGAAGGGSSGSGAGGPGTS